MDFDFYARWCKGEFVYELKDDGFALRLVENFRGENVAVTLFGKNDITSVKVSRDDRWAYFCVESTRRNVEFPAMVPTSQAIMHRLRKHAQTNAQFRDFPHSPFL